VSRHPRPRPLARRPSVTVVIPCYNYGHFLPRALESALGQPGVDVEALVIDDASPDGSGEVVRRLAAADPRITAIVHEVNRGHIATYNEGLEQARGDYCVLLSADDVLPPGALGRAAALMEAEPTVGMVYGHPMTFEDEPPAVPTKVTGWTVWTGREWLRGRARAGDNCIMNPEVVLRTSVQHAIGGYDPALPHAGDFEMWMRAAAVADVGRVNGAVQGLYRVHAASMQRAVYAGHVNDLEGRLDSFRKVLVGPGSCVRDGEALFRTARRALARSALEYARLAYDHGRAGQEPVAEYLAFAERVWPEIRRTVRWKTLERRAGLSPARFERGMVWKARRLADDLQSRVRFRVWRRYGV
jgi:glycosyltransferase involved in cell wall biosynthesis